MSTKYLDVNRQLWNKKTPIHLKSDFYELEDFKKGKSTLKSIELELLGDVQGKSILHLQCHFGQDSMSLSRMGAKVTGLDISDVAIDEAKKLNEELGLDTKFVCADVYSAKEHIEEKFDIVFTTYGTIGWLPNMDKWADIVSHFIKPDGKFLFVEFHPTVWMFDDNFKNISFSYFNIEPIVEESSGTYAQQDAEIQMEEVGWNHSLSEVFTSLMDKGLKISHFKEYDYSPHNCFKNMEERASDEFIITSIGDKLPMCYSLVMHF
ncbi:MAG: SAM-dependent methyltransferase [Bacteroidetes bacterium]|nr:MAG: SAM-dependent methyltransferase [Bacteroidota bacterium]